MAQRSRGIIVPFKIYPCFVPKRGYAYYITERQAPSTKSRPPDGVPDAFRGRGGFHRPAPAGGARKHPGSWPLIIPAAWRKAYTTVLPAKDMPRRFRSAEISSDRGEVAGPYSTMGLPFVQCHSQASKLPHSCRMAGNGVRFAYLPAVIHGVSCSSKGRNSSATYASSLAGMVIPKTSAG